MLLRSRGLRSHGGSHSGCCRDCCRWQNYDCRGCSRGRSLSDRQPTNTTEKDHEGPVGSARQTGTCRATSASSTGNTTTDTDTPAERYR